MTIRMKAIIGQENDTFTWGEDFTVSSKENAKEEIQKVIDTYNNSLRPNEKKRHIISLEDSKIKTLDDYLKEAQKFVSRVAREANNGYGSPWAKQNADKCYERMTRIETKGGLARFKKMVHDSCFTEEFRHLEEWKGF